MSKFSFSFEAIGTKWTIDCFEAFADEKSINTLIQKRIQEFDKTYSRFRKDSLVHRISKKSGKYSLPPDSKELLNSYDIFYKVTNGKLTPLVGNLLSEAGYDAHYSLKPKKLNKVPDLREVYSWNYPELIVKRPYILDFGALGKGYLIDIISNLLKENGVKSFCIDAGGDMIFFNLNKPMKVGLENPQNQKQVIGVIELNNKSICASSGNRRKWNKFHHIINPETFESENKILSTWVVANDTITADGLATALFFESPGKLSKYFDFEYFVLYPNFKFKKSKGFKAELFTPHLSHC